MKSETTFTFAWGGQTKDIAIQRLTDSFERNFWEKYFIISSCKKVWAWHGIYLSTRTDFAI